MVKEVKRPLRNWKFSIPGILLLTLIGGLLFFAPSSWASRQDAITSEGTFSYFLPLVQSTSHNVIWLSHEEISQLPMSGVAWEHVKEAADKKMDTPDLSDQDEDANVQTLAKALVYARTNDVEYRDEVVEALRVITYNNTENGGRTLALGRNLAAYVIAADIIGLGGFDPDLDMDFRRKLSELRTKKLDGKTLISTHEERPNNWGTHAGASRVAVALYLDDRADLNRAARVFKGWMGDRSIYAGFKYDDDLSWQCDPSKPVGINPRGCKKKGHSIDGAQPEEMRRGGSFTWPPEETGYPWEGLQGALVTAEMLRRTGYENSWEWQNCALLRAVDFLYGINWKAEGDDEWQLWLVDYAYSTNHQPPSSAGPGKNMGWTAWTHANRQLDGVSCP